MKKRRNVRINLLALTVLLILCLSSCMTVSSEHGAAPERKEGVNYFPDAEETVELGNGVTLTLSEDKSYYSANADSVTDEHLVIPEEYGGVPIGRVSMLEYEADNVKSVSLPDTVFSIGLSSFNGCTMLEYNLYGNAYYLGNEEQPYLYLIKAVSRDITSVAIHETTRVISGAAFSHCTNLRSVYIPDSVVNIENIAFYECTALESVSFGKGLRRIGGKCFYDCEKLKKVILPDGLEEIDDYAFYGCYLNELYLGRSVTTLGEHTFDSTNITSIEIPGSLKTVDSCAFRQCSELKSVVIHEGVRTIGEAAFSECTSLTEVSLPASLKRYERDAFGGCKKLKLTTLPAAPEFIDIRAFPQTVSSGKYGNGIYLGNGDSDYAYLVGVLAADIKLHPDTEALPYGLSYAFRPGDVSVTDISIKDGKYLEVRGSCVIDKRTGELLLGLADAVIPDDGSVKSIGYGAFYALKGLVSVKIPDSVESIGENAFLSCVDLTEVTIGDGVVSIGNCAFKRSGLQTVTFGSSVAHIGDEAFADTRITSAVLGDSLRSIGSKAFYHCGDLGELKLGDGIESIGEWAFSGVGITELCLPSSLKELGMGLFNYCNKLEKVVIDAEITEMSNCFNSCDKLGSVSLPASLKSVSASFRYCPVLTEIRFASDKAAFDALGLVSAENDLNVTFADGSSVVYPKIEK